MKKRIFALLLALALLLPCVPVFTDAAEGAMVSAGSATGTPGSWITAYIHAENFSAVASLDLEVYYDSSAMRLVSADQGWMLGNSLTSINTSTPGQIVLSCTSLDGLNGSDTLLMLQFEILPEAAAGTYDLTVAVGDAYNTTLSPISIGSRSGSVTVEPAQQTAQPFYFWCGQDRWELQKGDELTLTMFNSYGNSFVSADFTITYDRELLELEEIELNPALNMDGAVHSINTSIAGSARLVYASQQPVSSYELFTVKFRVVGDVNTQTDISVKASNVYQENLMPYLPYTVTSYVTLEKLPEVVDYPDVCITGDSLVLGKQTKKDVVLEAGAGVAAADFTLKYDPAVLRCVNVASASTLGSMGGMVVINRNFGNGTIRFSYINEKGYDETDVPMVTITWEPLQSVQPHYQVSISAVGIVDPDQKSITLEYVTDSDCIYQVAGKEPTCTEPGYAEYTCICGNRYTNEEMPATGHKFTNGVCDVCGETDTVTKLELLSGPTKTEYEAGQKLDTTGLTLKVSFTHGGEGEITEGFEISGYDPKQIGEQTVTVSFGGMSSTFTVTVTQSTLWGDANGDGYVDFSDAVLVLEYSAWLVGEEQLNLYVSDVNADGFVDFSDAVLILEYSAFLIDQFPVEQSV